MIIKENFKRCPRCGGGTFKKEVVYTLAESDSGKISETPYKESYHCASKNCSSDPFIIVQHGVDGGTPTVLFNN